MDYLQWSSDIDIILEMIEKYYGDEYKRTGYFAAMKKSTLFAFAIDGKENGTFVL